MGAQYTQNDTLQLTIEQGFPVDLDIAKHLKKPYTLSDLEGKIFEFHNKDGIRIYQTPPVRNFLVQNINGKWIYWGLVHILEITHDMVSKTTSGKFKIIYLNSPDEMKQAFDLIDRRDEMNFFR